MKIGTATTPLNNPLKKPAFACLTVFLALLMAGCGQANHAQLASQENLPLKVSEAAQHIKIKLGIEHNYLTAGCPNNTQDCYRATMTLQLPTNMPQDWRILFSHLSPINKSISEAFNLSHINGDMHQISPKAVKLQANTAYKITFYGNTPLVSGSVLFPNYLLVAGDGKTSIIASTTEHIAPGHQVPSPQHIMPFTRPEQMLRKADDKVAIADANERFARFSARTVNHTAAQAPRIIPQLHTAKWSGTTIELHTGLRLPKMPKNLATAVIQRFNANAIETSPQGLPIMAKLQTDATPQSYVLSISTNKIQIDYGDSAGFYYAMMSIAQLYDASSQSLPIGVIHDQPNMAFRGLHIDVSRNFRSKDFILQTLDQMSYYKLNKLHLHLADDEGWRLQIDGLPELTQVGAFRCWDEAEQNCLLPQLAGGNGELATTRQNSGFYSVNDYIEILQYAHARQIEVLPSLDMPGHSRAAIVSMNARYHRLMQQEKPAEAQQYFLTELADSSQYRSIQHYNDNTLNPCLPATYTFVSEVLNQLIHMHKTAGVPLKRYHIGADETAGAWTDSPACKALIASDDRLTEAAQLGSYFVEKVANTISELGIVPAAWSDGFTHANDKNLPNKVQSNAWETLYSGGHTKVHKMLNKGWEVVLSSPDVLYFDFPYEADPIEPGYYWGSRSTDTYQVFQFMPHNLAVHAEIWKDKFGHDYQASASIDIQNNRQVLGIQAQLWGETVRSDAQANYMLYPRLLAVAERAWHSPAWAEPYQSGVDYSAESTHFDDTQKHAMNTDWLGFSQVLTTKAMPQLIKDSIVPRVPLPGARQKDGGLTLHSAMGGLPLEYKVSGQDWQLYKNPTALPKQNEIRIRAKIPNSQISSREQVLPAMEQ
ncbi:family 20 glycosylhydrolase [uncultured Paraglaciecola sp.]|uniref:family 20 glycosylhydrolase n=1 Tax=uncultured Paraglaciecola sp. TaxID=1765024 RepID=UPI0026259290|nr:family 20 glycosylhydrolase [uncultured Paraglaciecola sp.]